MEKSSAGSDGSGRTPLAAAAGWVPTGTSTRIGIAHRRASPVWLAHSGSTHQLVMVNVTVRVSPALGAASTVADAT